MARLITDQKKELRGKYRRRRSEPDEREKIDGDIAIFNNIVSLPEFIGCAALLSYVSVNGETDTRRIIEYALDRGRPVAVPRCVPGEKKLEFYAIRSLSELRTGYWGLLEPDASEEKRIFCTRGAVCLVPGLSFDRFGNRIGYGGGYYDRFLGGFEGTAVGLCGARQLHRGAHPTWLHDKRVDVIVTENEIIRLP